MTSQLMTGEEEIGYGDIGADKHEDAILINKNSKKIEYLINLKPSQIKKLRKELSPHKLWRMMYGERQKSKTRAKVEHVFAVVKRQLGFRRTRIAVLPNRPRNLIICSHWLI